MTVPMHVPETREDMARVLYERWFGMGSWDADSKTSHEMRDCQLREADFVIALIAADREQQRAAAIAPVIMHHGDAWPPKESGTDAAAMHRIGAVLRAGPDAAEMTTDVLGRW